jgi:SHS2 domain-containing protein
VSGADPFEVIEHTADVGIVARGDDLGQLFANAARGMLHFIIEPRFVEGREERPVEVEADDIEGLLVAWLNELLVVLNADGFIPGEFDLEEVTPSRLRATVRGEPVDPSRHRFSLDVKAATYHALRVVRTNGWSARVIFDV